MVVRAETSFDGHRQTTKGEHLLAPARHFFFPSASIDKYWHWGPRTAYTFLRVRILLYVRDQATLAGKSCEVFFSGSDLVELSVFSPLPS